MGLRLPVLTSLSGYQPGWVRSDVSAGLAVAAVGLPSAIAYPAIAGLPPETGIYASIAPLVAYAIFGPSRQLIVGPDAATMTVLAAVLVAVTASVPVGLEVERTAIAAILALGVGLFCLAAWVLRLGVLATFLSRPILTGFFIGISLSILIGQIGRFTGVKVEAEGLLAPVLELLRKAGSIHWPSLLLALGMFGLLQIARAMRFPVPGPVLVVVLSVVLSAVFDFEGRGIAVVGDIPTGLPSLSLPAIADLPIQTLALGAAAIFLVSYGAGIITARSFGAIGGYPVDPNRELIGFSAANIGAGLFGAFPVTASDSRTAVNLTVGGRSQVTSIVAAATLIATLLFLGPTLRIIPIPALGAILAATAISLIDLAALRQIWRISRMEFVFALIAMWGPIGLGVLNGVVIAIGATLVYVLRKLMFPRDAMLGRVPGHDGFYKLHRTPEARQVPGLAVCLIQGSLLFFNTDYVASRLRSIAEELPADTRWLLIDASAISQIDSSAAAMLEELCDELRNRGIRLGVAELHTEARDILVRAGVIERIGSDMVFDILEEAYHAFEAQA
ncbi:MAG: SulP family inorganic anion transporter [Mesorhizobium sp.]|uniref:SulP family inorganic anion transporter n=1 Tax=Mesorhizobium sp. TaxID=1871066 RepID=UPI000FE2C575|nr:SulP family inorganic anion transporter [Mesorhizobium sp.]RWN60754.1 MAG: SulP family inorganic anion transporter [Mesorhizobium sp.]RWO29293.1 MAG: SulP family inorganic anion transporter [Mesorhizobium sp.]RWO39251.1 MAG: SulP family inorganic anion transporter [Mesorhizobium sp.]